jgi:hypothetical protein
MPEPANARSTAVIDQVAAESMGRELTSSFSGEVVIPGRPGYDEARTIWNAMVDKKPELGGDGYG